MTHLINTFEKDFRRATKATRNAGIVGIVGGAGVIAGLALVPFTMGASAVIGGAGAAVAAGGGIGSGLLNFRKMIQQKKICENIKNELEEFQNKITHLTETIKHIYQSTNEKLIQFKKKQSTISIVEI